MKTPEVDVSYHDLSSLQRLRSQVKTDEVGAIRQAAQQFESVFMGMLMKSMRSANQVFEKDNPLKSNATDFFRDMHDNQMSAELSKQGALGLADLMVQQLKPDQSTIKAASQVSMPSRFDVEVAKDLRLPGESRQLQLPTQGRRVFQLDPERIVTSAASMASVAEAKSLALPAVTAISASPASSMHTKIQQLPQEVAVGGGWSKMSAPLAAESLVAHAKSGMSDRMASASTHMSPATVTQQDATQAVTVVTAEKKDPNVAFIQRLLPAAQAAAPQLGLDPLALIAQAALETGWGQRMFDSTQGANSHNLFGIKAGSSWQGDVAVVDTLEYRQGVAQKEKARFRAYDSIEQSMQDYVALIQQSPRYEAALNVAADIKSYFKQLQAAGYATDPNYAQKILAVLNSSAFEKVRQELKLAQDFTFSADEQSQ